FHNVCSHRGSRLCPGESGTMAGKRIMCPYHGWTYSPSDGSLLGAPSMHADFDRTPWGLHPVHVDVWLGFIFVCFAGEGSVSMADYLGDLDFAGFDPHGLKLAAIKTIDVNANWKIVVENNQECYHCSLNHHELLTSVDWRILGTDDFDGYVTKRANGLEV